jgi:FMN phosphatase YigB (HAD superfamily)
MTGQSYAATQTEDGRSIAHELLTLTNRFVESEWEPARQAFESDPQNADFERVYERIDRQLQDFVEMMDYLRELRSAADFGNAR